MNSTYSGQHSIYFNDSTSSSSRGFNTWVKWKLIPLSPPVVTQPSPTFKYVDIPGMDGSLDLTDYLVGRPTYSDCSGSFSFYVDNDQKSGQKLKEELSQYFDGRTMIMTLTDDQNFYYIGRFFFKEYQPSNPNSTVTIDYRVRPYKYKWSDRKPVLIY